MKIWEKIRNILVIAGIMTVFGTVPVWAGTTVDITGGENAQVGGNVEVTVTMQNVDHIAESDMFISYDTSKLQFVSGDDMELLEDGRIRIRGAYTDSPEQKSWTITFTALQEGDVTLRAENVWVKDGQGDTGTGITSNAGTVSISGQAAAPTETAAADAQQTTVPEPDGDALSALEQEIANDGTMSCLVNGEKWFVKEEFGTNILMPGFVLASAFYKGVEVTAAKLNNAEFYLLFLQSEDGTQEKYAVYDQETKHFSDVERVDTEGGDSLYLAALPMDLEIPSYFEETTYAGHQAWQITGNTEYPAYAADPSEYYIFYGYDLQGNGGFHLLDTKSGKFQRYVEMIPTASETVEVVGTQDGEWKTKYDNLVSRFDFLVTCIKYIAVALVALLLLLLIVNLADQGNSDKDSEKKKKKEAKKKAKKEKKEKKDDAGVKEPESAPKKTAAEPKKPESAAKKTAAEPKKPESAPKKAAAEPKKTEPAAKKAESAVKEIKVDDFNDDFVDDYIDVSKAAPKNEQEEKAIGVLKPLQQQKTEQSPKESAEMSIEDSIAELSKHIQKTMKEEKPVDMSGLEELRFIDLDDDK